MSFTKDLSAIQAVTEKLLTALTPAARAGWHVAAEVYQVNAIQHLIYGGLALVGFLLALWVLRGTYNLYTKNDAERLNKLTSDDEASVALLSIVGGVFALICVIVMCNTLADVWYWVALFRPQLYTAHEILQATLQRR